MGELGDALKLLHGDRPRFRTLRATVRERFDEALARRAEERFAASPEGRASGFDDALSHRPDTTPRTRERTVRLWLEGEARVREEAEGDMPGGAEVAIRDGQQWWRYDPEYGVHSNEDDLAVGTDVGDQDSVLFEPSGLLGSLAFEVRGRTRVATREAIVLRARRRAGSDEGFGVALFMLGLGADEYELAVDAERGILLRAAALVDGKEFSVREVLEIAFDEDFPPETFKFTAPEGARVRLVREPQARAVTIEEAARLASFPVWFPVRLSGGWRVEVGYFAGEEQQGEPETVAIGLAREDATHWVRIGQQESGAPDEEDWETWEEIERDGERFSVGQSEDRPTKLRFEREGTRVTLRSDLALDSLIDLARMLEGVEAGPRGPRA